MKQSSPLIVLLVLVLAGGAAWYLLQGTGAPEPPEAPVAGLLSGKPQTVPVPGQVTMVDIGAHSCVPCKMMTPILAEVSDEYQERAAIVFIDVWEYPDEIKRFGIVAIPTQIFYDASGEERFRHEGFLSKEKIVSVLEELGAPEAQ